MSFNFSEINNSTLNIGLRHINVEIYSIPVLIIKNLDEVKEYLASYATNIEIIKTVINHYRIKLVFISYSKLEEFFTKIIHSIQNYTNELDNKIYNFIIQCFTFAREIHIDFLNHQFIDLKFDSIGYFSNYNCKLYLENLKANSLNLTYGISTLPKFQNTILNEFKYKRQYSKKEFPEIINDKVTNTYINQLIESSK